MLMLRSQFLSEILASRLPLTFGGGLDFGDIGVYRSSFRGLVLPVLLLSLTRDKLGHYGEFSLYIKTKRPNL